MPLSAVPARDEVQQVDALCCLTVLLTLVAGQLNLKASKYRQPRVPIAHPHQSRVEVDFRSKGRDGEKASPINRHERRDCLVEEALVNVGSLLEDNDVATSPLRGPNLSEQGNINMKSDSTLRATRTFSNKHT